MTELTLNEIFSRFDTGDKAEKFTECFNGHINRTYFVTVDGEEKYVLQKINTGIFKKPEELTENVIGVTGHIRAKVKASGGDTEREVLTLISAKDGKYFTVFDGEYWRLYLFIKNTISFQSVENPKLFYNSAVAFGKFQRQLADYPAEKLHETIPNFHNTVSRYSDFEKAVDDNLAGRRESVKAEIDFVKARKDVCSYITDRIADGRYPLRVTHNDTKLNNIMMDPDTLEGVCVIDLDTVMPGSVLYDFGDSIRFGASSADEDERDLDKVYMRTELFEEYTKGFVSGLEGSLTDEEIRGLPMGALVITFETGIRFLTDYLNGDTYFATHREGQNLDRARTQFKLVADMEKKMPELEAIMEKYIIK